MNEPDKSGRVRGADGRSDVQQPRAEGQLGAQVTLPTPRTSPRGSVRGDASVGVEDAAGTIEGPSRTTPRTSSVPQRQLGEGAWLGRRAIEQKRRASGLVQLLYFLTPDEREGVSR